MSNLTAVPPHEEVAMSGQPTMGNVRTWVLREGSLPLKESVVELGEEPIVIDDTPGRKALFFAFDGPGVLGLRSDTTGSQGRHVAPAADAITDGGPISAWIESVGL
jgi:hypothetical protein